jgi:hypothetical protein
VRARTRPAAPDPDVQLLDGNVLVALTDAAHVHHEQAVGWFANDDRLFATCPITQGNLLRMLLRLGGAPDIQTAQAVLGALTSHARHRFWPDNIDYGAVLTRGLQGHRQVTDAYLAALARHHHGRLVTFDRGLAALHGDVATLIG